MSELQPQMTFEAAPINQPEAHTLIQNVLSRSRKALAIGGSVLAMGGVASVEASAATVFDDRPPITMKPGVEGFNAGLAASCRNNMPAATQVKSKPWYVAGRHTFKLAPRTNRRGVVQRNINDVTDCDGYGKRTAITYLMTKNKGQKIYRKGGSIIDRTHHGRRNMNSVFDLAQACRTGMAVRYVTVSNYVDYTGKSFRKSFSTPAKTVSCKR